jgi:hypothetical protein
LGADDPYSQTFIQLSTSTTNNVAVSVYIGTVFGQDATNSLYKCESPQGTSTCSVIFPACVYFTAGALYIGVHNPGALSATGNFLLTLVSYPVYYHRLGFQQKLTPTFSQTFGPGFFNVTLQQAPVRVTLEVTGLTTAPLDSDSVRLFARRNQHAGVDRQCYTYSCEVNLVVPSGTRTSSCSFTVSAGDWFYLVAWNRQDLTEYSISLTNVRLSNSAHSSLRSCSNFFISLVLASLLACSLLIRGVL